MKITYTSGSRFSDQSPRRKGGKSRNIDVIATLVVAILLIGGVIYWFVYSQATKVEPIPTPAVVPLPKELIERPFNAADGLKQCEKLTPTLSSQAEKDKRAKCYAAVMTVFGTTDICKAAQLDSTSASLCAAAQASYEQTHPALPTGTSRQNPTNTNSLSAINTILNRTNTNTSTSGGSSGTSGTVARPGTQPPGTTSRPGTQPPTTSTSTTTTSTPGTIATNTPTPPPPTPTGTQPPTNGTASSTTPIGSTPTVELCIIDPGQLVLLQHTNECQ